MGPNDLDEETTLLCKDSGGEIKIEYSGNVEGYIVAKKLDTSGDYGCSYDDKNFYYISDVEAKTKGGWGPMLYDVLMEYLFLEHNSGLVADRERVSGDAIGIWDFYFNRRSDVDKVPLDLNDATKEYFGSKLNLQNRPNQTGNSECYQVSSVEHAAGAGDWMSKKLKSWIKRRKLAIKNAEKAVKWYEQSISYGFFKTDGKILNQLGEKFKKV